jgi:hypothetical protein
MAERVIKFGGIDPLSRTEWGRGDSEPDTDPRASQGTDIVSGVHLMSAVEQLEPCVSTRMAYFDPGSPVNMTLGELEEAVRAGDVSLQEVMTVTDRFEPTVNPRRSRQKGAGDRDPDNDGDLWHVPTSNYNARPPRERFEPLARAIDDNDAIDNSGVYGEFRERRNGGEVYGEVWFDDFDVGAMDGDPVRLGIEFRYNYFGDMAFSYRPYAQRTRCKNSVRALDTWEPVMAHNQEPNFRERYDELLRELGLYGDALSQQIQTASELVFDFESDIDPEDAEDGVVPVPVSVEGFYENAGLPDPRTAADAARDEASGAARYDGGPGRISAWHLHNGATYWLSWHWNGSEGTRAFRQYRRAADDMLINPHQMADRVRESYEEGVREDIIADVAGEPGARWDDLDEQQRQEVESRMMDHDGVDMARRSVESLETMVESFEETEERLDAIAAQIDA